MKVIPYGRQDISEKDIEAVCDVLRSDFLTQGPKIQEFESRLSSYTGAKFTVAMNSATSALHIACLALDVGPGDLVWTTPVTFVASANCVLYCGGEVDFVDIDSRTYNMCSNKLEEKLKVAKSSNRLPKVLIPVHLSGQSCDMEAIHRLSLQYGFKIIEDASHAIGGKYKDQKIGNCRYSDITIFSFHPVKIVTTAEGGAALTNDNFLAEKLSLLRTHGITRSEELMKNKSHGPWYYEQIALGFNYRITDMQAALGISQLDRLDAFVSRRQEVAKNYFKMLETTPLILPFQSSENYSAYHLFIVRISEKLKSRHKEIFVSLREKGIGVNLHYMPVYMQPYYEALGFKKGLCPVAEDYYSTAISIPMFSALSPEDQVTVCNTIKEVLEELNV
jgi:UDP-4-amino-4,6-dideoxy-N-acetyl-beta-L-altrosamine transaminase